MLRKYRFNGLTLLHLFFLVVTTQVAQGKEKQLDKESENTRAIIKVKRIEEGKVLFEKKMCLTCHSLEEGKVVVGPSLAKIASRFDRSFMALQLKNPKENFKNTSIFERSLDKTPKMPKPILTDEELNILVDFLMTLK